MNLMAELMPAGAEIFLLVMVCVILIVDLLLAESNKIYT